MQVGAAARRFNPGDPEPPPPDMAIVPRGHMIYDARAGVNSEGSSNGTGAQEQYCGFT